MIYHQRSLFLLVLYLFGPSEILSQINSSCIIANILSVDCQENGAKEPQDDKYFFDIEILGGTSIWQFEHNEVKYSGYYGDIYSFGPFLKSEGPISFVIRDSLNKDCIGFTTIFPPSSCQSCLDQQLYLCHGDTAILAIPSSFLSGDSTLNFQWYKNSLLIPYATDNSYHAVESGTYTVEAYTLNSNCAYQSCCQFNIFDETKPRLENDTFTSCPGDIMEYYVNTNDYNLNTPNYQLITFPSSGNISISNSGKFIYSPINNTCFNDQFTYEVCNNSDNKCCDTATVFLQFNDSIYPTLIGTPADITISCDEEIPYPAKVSARDNCPNITVNIHEETSTIDSCSSNITIRRIWTVKDGCDNITLDTQLITIEDRTAPDIFLINTLPDGRRMIGGVMENVNHNWKEIYLPIDFTDSPLIFTQIITDNEKSVLTTRIKNVSSSQFELKLQAEGSIHQDFLRESVAWVAIEPGVQSDIFQLEAKKISLTDAWKQINFEESYHSLPSFFATMQTMVDKDPATIRCNHTTTNSTHLSIVEETSLNLNTIHDSEQVAFLVLAKNIDLTNKRGHHFGETGSVSVNHQWLTVQTKHNYYNPVVIAGVPQSNEKAPGVASIRNVTANSFDIRFQEWDYLDGNHEFESIPYLVMEGSIPLDASIMCELGTDSLNLGQDLIALDNCDTNVSLDYNEQIILDGNVKKIVRSWFSQDECNNQIGYSQVVSCDGVGLRLKAMLQGALIGSTEDGLMRDDLRKKGLIPLVEPYTAIPNFNHQGAGGGEKTTISQLSIVGKKAIVDWGFIELKSELNQDEVVATKSALIQRNGEVVDVIGNEIIYFENLPPGNYFVCLRHRNHLKAETKYPYFFSKNHIPFIDFSDNFLPTKGEIPFIKMNRQNALWSGDLNQSGDVIYQGPTNDIFNIFLQVIIDSLNQNHLSNFINRGYTFNDFNLDGTTIFQGPNNDRANLLFNTILNHPQNDKNLVNYVISTKEKVIPENINGCILNPEQNHCDYDNDGKLNNEDPDDDNDGVIDGNDQNPYNEMSDSDNDGVKDRHEKEYGSNPNNPCDPYQNHEACKGIDMDGDGKFANYPSNHSLFDENDRDPCTPIFQTNNCNCPDEDNDGFIFICHTTESHQKQTLRITLEQWRLRQAVGDICGECQ